jgi:hypothetical protein
MNRRLFYLFSLFLASLFAVPTFAQCKNQQDKACWSLQYILYASQTDFREFRGITPLKPSDRRLTPPNPDLSVGEIHVPCHTDFWLSSEVPVYMCSAELPAQEVEEWYAKTMADLHELQYLWQFKESPGTDGTDHYVDAGPQGCDPPHLETTNYGAYHVEELYIADGPYLGQCPLHLQTVRQTDGNSRISFWLNSLVNLARNPRPTSQSPELSATAKPAAPQPRSAVAPVPEPAQVPQPAPAASAMATPATTNPASATAAAANPMPATSLPAATESSRTEALAENSVAPSAKRYGDCDDLCQGLKKVLENRASSFRQLAASSASSLPSKTASLDPGVKLYGAESCSIHAEPSARTTSSANSEFFPGANFAPVSAKSTKSPTSRVASRPAKQYVCYWPQDSETAAKTEFRDLASLLQMLIPSTWSAQQKSEADELTGAPVTIWSARDSRNKAAIRMYLIGRSVGLHISSAE